MHYNTTYADKRDAKYPRQSKDLPPKEQVTRDVRLLLVQLSMWPMNSFTYILSSFATKRVKFGDEKNLKGKLLYN